MLAFFVALVCISSVYSQCSNSGCWMQDGFTFSYSRVGNDYVDIYATVETDTWVGVGISADQLMPNTDSVVGARDGNQYFLDDRYNIAPRTTLPPFDAQQDITMKVVTEENGYTSIQFRRPINSTDVTYDINLSECRWVLWAYGGVVTSYGTDGMNGIFGGHSAKGVFSNQICLCADASAEDTPIITNKDCAASATTAPPDGTTAPPDDDSGAANVIISVASLMVMVVVTMFFSF